MSVLLSRFVAWISTALFGMFGAYKVFLVGGFMAFLGVTLYSLLIYGLEDILSFVTDQLSGVSLEGLERDSTSFSGFMGWFLSVMKIPECMSFIIAAVMLKWTLRKIPFIKW